MNDNLILTRRERDRRPVRFVVFGIVTILIFAGLTARLAYLQITNGQTLSAAVQQQHTAEIAIPATRGLIFDRNGRQLVQNVATWAVKITPSDLPYAQRDTVARRLAGLLGMEPNDILTTIDTAPGSRFDPVRIAQDVPEDTARLVSESSDELPGVQVVVETRREYPDGPLLAHILGYTGPIDAASYEILKPKGYLADDLIGKTGVESTFEIRASRHVRHPGGGEGRHREAGPGPVQQAGCGPRSVARAHHRHQDPAGGHPGPQVGHARGRLEARACSS